MYDHFLYLFHYLSVTFFNILILIYFIVELNVKKINEWQNRAKGVFRRFMTTICVRFQDLTSK